MKTDLGDDEIVDEVPCVCGHMVDEHEDSGGCEVAECRCILFEADRV